MNSFSSLKVGKQRGFSMLEVLIAVVVIAIGLLGLAGLQTKLLAVEMESYQRSTALMLLENMMNRIRANEQLALSGTFDKSSAIDCAKDSNHPICEWFDSLKGMSNGKDVGGVIGAKGCVDNVPRGPGFPKTIRVSVAWQGLSATTAPPADINCGKGEYGDEAFRRVLSSMVVVLEEEEE